MVAAPTIAPNYYAKTRGNIELLAEQLELDHTQLARVFAAKYSQLVMDDGAHAAEMYAIEMWTATACLRVHVRYISDPAHNSRRLPPFVNAVAAIINAAGIYDGSPSRYVRTFARGYLDLLLNGGEFVANEHADKVAFDFATLSLDTEGR